MITEKSISNKIYFIRGREVMIDRDLAELYGVETRILNQSVRRNIKRFPEDFMFQLSPEEFNKWKSQIVISNKEKMSLRKPPLVFTEQGVSMLSSVLHSETAIMVNIQIIRVFTRLRQMIQSQEAILKRLVELEKEGKLQKKNIQTIIQYLKQLEEIRKEEIEFKDRKKIGFHR